MSDKMSCFQATQVHKLEDRSDIELFCPAGKDLVCQCMN